MTHRSNTQGGGGAGTGPGGGSSSGAGTGSGNGGGGSRPPLRLRLAVEHALLRVHLDRAARALDPHGIPAAGVLIGAGIGLVVAGMSPVPAVAVMQPAVMVGALLGLLVTTRLDRRRT